MSPPKLFISYSRTSEPHNARVLALATRLRESGIDVILDVWRLREGQDSNAFMEQMVASPDVGKVALFCDQRYAERANERTGGVGTEAQIISAALYGKTQQSKFVAVLLERAPDGSPPLPIYYAGRIYVDLSDPNTHGAEFERLIRWVFDKPKYIEPPIGSPPAFLEGTTAAAPLLAGDRYRLAMDSVRHRRPLMEGAVTEYFADLARHFESFRLKPDGDTFDDAVVASIEAFMPVRNQFLELVAAAAQFQDNHVFASALHRCFDQLVPYLDRPSGVTHWKEWDFDNYRFIIHELFLFSVAIYLRQERFFEIAALLDPPYYVAEPSNSQSSLVYFPTFRRPVRSLTHRNKRLGLRRLSVQADLLRQRCTGLPIDFRHVMQADLLLFLNADLRSTLATDRWWPETLVYASQQYLPFEVFARARSRGFLERFKSALGRNDLVQLRALVESYQRGDLPLPRWEFDSFSPVTLTGLADLGTLP